MLHRLSGSPAASPEKAAQPWAAEAIGWLAERGLIPQGMAPTSPLTLAQGESLLSALS